MLLDASFTIDKPLGDVTGVMAVHRSESVVTTCRVTCANIATPRILYESYQTPKTIHALSRNRAVRSKMLEQQQTQYLVELVRAVVVSCMGLTKEYDTTVVYIGLTEIFSLLTSNHRQHFLPRSRARLQREV